MKTPFHALSVLTLALPLIGQAHPPRYLLVPLPPLGQNVHQFGGFVSGINQVGIAVGSSTAGDEAVRPTVWLFGRPVPLNAPTNTYTVANAINSSGHIVGTVQSGNVTRAAAWVHGGFHFLDSPGFPNSYAVAINDAGLIVGQESSADNLTAHAVVWTNGVASRLRPFRGDQMAGASSINNRGDVGGASGNANGTFRPVVWRGGMPQALPLPAKNGTCGVSAINDHGQTIGDYTTLDPLQALAVFWTPNDAMFIPLMFPESEIPMQRAAGINNSGQVIGSAFDEDHDQGAAFLFQDGRLFDLNDLLLVSGGYNVIEADSINDQGWIGAWARHGASETAVVLIPVR